MPGCPGWHGDDLACTDMLDALDAEARGERWPPTPARLECLQAPSRTQPFHAFGIRADGGECEHCGIQWDPSRDGDADA
jgi:hypothetical protein